MSHPETPQKPNPLLRELYKAAQKGDLRAIEELIASAPPGSDLERELASFTPEAWQELVAQEENEAVEAERRRKAEEERRAREAVEMENRRQEQLRQAQHEAELARIRARQQATRAEWGYEEEEESKGSPLRMVLFGVIGLVVLTAMFGGGFLIGRKIRPPEVTPVVTEVTTVEPAVTEALIDQPTPIPPSPETPPPDVTEVVDTPVVTEEVLAPTPTPPPVSRYYLGAGQPVYPPVPLQAEGAWVLDELFASAEPPFADTSVWTAGKSQDTKGNREPFFYTGVGNAKVTWQMDQPLEDGFYALYFLDTNTQSVGSLDYTVFLSGEPASPYRGGNTFFLNSVAGGQLADEWVLMGIYPVAQGQVLSVEVRIGERTSSTAAAVDRLLVEKLSWDQEQILATLPNERPLVMLMDDTGAVFRAKNYGKLNPQPVSTFTGDLAWNGAFKSLPGPWEAEIQVDWPSTGRLPAGQYEMYVWIPANFSTAEVEYQLIANTKLLERPNPAVLRQADWSGEWLSVGLWTLPEEAAVSVRMVVPVENAGNEIGADAVALVWVGP